MKAEHVDTFTRGGDPYKKLRVGRHRDPPTFEDVDFVVEWIYSHWFRFVQGNKSDGITTVSFVADDGHGQSVMMHTKKMDVITKHNKEELMSLITRSLEWSGLRYDTKEDLVTYDINIYYQWKYIK